MKYVKNEVPGQPEPGDTDPEEPATPDIPDQPVSPEQPVVSVPETPESNEVIDQELPVAPVTPIADVQEHDVEPTTTNIDSNKELVKAPAEKNSKGNKELPQTGEKDTTAIIGLGLIAGWMGLLGLGKRKSKS